MGIANGKYIVFYCQKYIWKLKQCYGIRSSFFFTSLCVFSFYFCTHLAMSFALRWQHLIFLHRILFQIHHYRILKLSKEKRPNRMSRSRRKIIEELGLTVIYSNKKRKNRCGCVGCELVWFGNQIRWTATNPIFCFDTNIRASGWKKKHFKWFSFINS